MLLKLQRSTPSGNTLAGTLYIDGKYYCDTIENNSHKIQTGFYPVRLTQSPSWDEVLPLIDHVIGRSGIRIHPGNTAADSTGCILVGRRSDKDVQGHPLKEPRLLSSRKTFNPLRDQLLAIQRSHEPIFLEISKPLTFKH